MLNHGSFSGKILRMLIILGTMTFPFSSTAQQDYISYYKLVSAAGKCATNNNYDSALINYKAAFEKVDYVRTSDLYQAIVIAKKNGNKTQASAWKQLLKKERKAINKKYKAEISAISKADQKIRDKKHEQANNYYYSCLRDSGCDRNSEEFLKAKTLLDEWHRTDSADIHKLLDLIQLYGYPSDRNVGAIAEFKAFPIILHYDNDSTNTLQPILDSALYSGDLTPHNYAWLVDRRLSWDNGKAPYYYELPDGLENLSKDQIAEVNKRRASIGLGDVYDGLTFFYEKGVKHFQRNF